ncbi:ImmA/IrrE family metallo-endopeptidase [Rhodophyticola porphyridii]|uniref:ImmA/IrrE family metallo-endopeptidase n=1 Tax=Rhodophyticola porphyridii TaxID=1852017 RepID=A0A3L9Y201_9RHOB|nr:ImmA/IrrE family metallo-endopeptidase [Rhodophyticola porphyridii]RMA41107.1 ImmA/IrrE family metallo-endopeptidase [Rhodophyticola porphyridii]
MTRLKHGLRTFFEDLATQFRGDLGLQKHAPMCPRALAEWLEIPILGTSQLEGDTDPFKWLLEASEKQFFGCVIPLGDSRKGILHNDYVAESRQASDIAHEIAHIVLGHPLTPPDCGDGTRDYDPILEHEARELGMTLLVPKHAALKIAMSSVSNSDAGRHYGVSPSLVEYRLRITNAKNWAYNKRNRARGF